MRYVEYELQSKAVIRKRLKASTGNPARGSLG